ncbi:MAG: glutamine synthetase [Myxococcales bacterium]|nr:glutamine synthetase [Myxococcales bacterium]
MSASDLETVLADLPGYLDRNDIRFHKVAVTDTDGIMRGKYMCRDKFLSAARGGFGFCDVVLGWDSNDKLYDNTKVSGWHTGYRDAPVELDLGSVRPIPFEPQTGLWLGSFAGDYADACPRTILRRLAAKAAFLGFEALGSAEYEFFLFDETPASARAKGYRDLKPFTPGMFGYSLLRAGVHFDLYQELLDTFAAMDVEIEGLHTETGPGVIEAALRYDAIGKAADNAAIFKTYMKILAQRRGLMATFMAKWSADYPGQSGHIHVSLAERGGDGKPGKNVFYDPAEPATMSETMAHFVAGQVALLPELLPMVCPTINSYRRLVPGMWAPLASNWGVENRTTAIRIIPGEKSQRSEFRIGPADANPYLAMAAALGAGLYGIEKRLPLPDPIDGNAYELQAQGKAGAPLPTNLADATARFKASKAAREIFGDTFVDHFAATREWEIREAQRHVSDWDLARYFEII